MAPVVVFELNEVPWKVLDWWVARRPDGALAALVGSSHRFTTVCPDEGHLSPWITWPTVHRGVPNTVHGIGHFGQDTTHADEVAPPWWQTITAAGKRAGVFGLLHTAELPDDRSHYAFFVPDTFAPTERTHPPDLEAFQAFNLSMARASARNVSTSVDVPAATAFLKKAPALGVRPTTMASVGKQLLDERRRPLTRVRRRSYQSVLAFDLFDRQLRDTRPDVAAFFTNHVASAMHRYWAATFPEDYPPDEFGFDVDWVRSWRDEIDHALGHADRMLARLLGHADDVGAAMVVCSSMGQQAAQGTPVRRQLVLADLERFLADAGIDARAHEVRPAMVPQVNFVLDPGAQPTLRARLDALRVGGAPVACEQDGDFFSLTFGQADDAIGEITVDGSPRPPAELGLEIVDIEDEVSSTGYHIPEGTLLVRPPGGVEPTPERPEVSTATIAPTLHALVGLEPAPHHVEQPLDVP